MNEKEFLQQHLAFLPLNADLEIVSYGEFSASAQVVSYCRPDLDFYRLFSIQENKLEGFVLVGNREFLTGYQSLVDQQKVLTEEAMEKLAFEDPGKKKLVVIGNGMVGQKFLEELAAAQGLNHYQVTVCAEENRVAYDRVRLSAFFDGVSAEALSLTDEKFFQEHSIELFLNDPVEAIDKENKKVSCRSGRNLDYDLLVLATGSYPFVPPIPGHDLAHCLVYRTIEDLEKMQASAEGAKIGVVVGGGLLGLEAANALKNMGLETHVVEFASRLMPVQLDDAGAELLKQKVNAMGIQVHTSKNTKNISENSQVTDGQRLTMTFADGGSLTTDMIVFSAGIRPRDELAKAAGLSLGQRGGIIINDFCQTSDPAIFAIGECALWQGQIFGLVAPGYNMARSLANFLLEKEHHLFQGADMSTKLKLLGVEVASIGDAHAKNAGALYYAFTDKKRGIYKKIVVSADNKRLLGAILVGDSQDYGLWLQLYLAGTPLPEHPETLILPTIEGKGLGAEILPATATICSCHNINKGQLIAAIDSGCHTIGELKKTTKAATGCGGCAQICTQILQAELKKRGLEVKKDLCEHFAYSRQELFHLVKIQEIKTFAELLDKHGQGRGCDICKPAVASILASVWNDYILSSDHQSLQDTNDAFLANIQRNGTYSIVPRVPGGEITPAKLIAIGRIAEKYRLYTKITGGQRIDLFGAELSDLPKIWQELIEHGFESGHAYAKALRTVKSCVGSTWCRYGVQDAVGAAIFLENRYKGLRSPHKIKMGVSGCTRECAEAQAKDVGVIATEKGYNLYVCGNGGAKPRHANLLATDLDLTTLTRYVDRFFMFYIQTAERLQRTANWLEHLEGGIDYLRAVVVDDHLGIAEELEARMQHIVDTYQCEWKTTLEQPEKLLRFRRFINAPEAKDPHVVMVEERGQYRPASPQEKALLEEKS